MPAPESNHTNKTSYRMFMQYNNMYTPVKFGLFISLVVALLITVILYAGTYLEATGYSIWQLPIFFLFIFILWLIQVAVARKLDQRLPWSKGFSRRLLAGLGISFIVYLLVLNLPYAIFKWYSLHYWERPGSSYSIYIFLSLNSVGFIFYILVASLYLGFTFIQQWQETQIMVSKLRDENNQARIQVFKQQLNPHFIFNNLNILTALIDKDADNAKAFVEQFSSAYRYVLEGGKEELVTLKMEMDFIDTYLFLLQTRFQEGIVVQKQMLDSGHHHWLPPFALQILIENCIKHNIVSVHKPLVIQVIQEPETILVKNNLQLREYKETGTHTGLQNIINRYGFFTDRPVMIEETDTYFSVRVPLLQTHEDHYH